MPEIAGSIFLHGCGAVYLTQSPEFAQIPETIIESSLSTFPAAIIIAFAVLGIFEHCFVGCFHTHNPSDQVSRRMRRFLLKADNDGVVSLNTGKSVSAASCLNV